MEKERCTEKGRDEKGFYSLVQTPNSPKPMVFRDLGTARRQPEAREPLVKNIQNYVTLEKKPAKPRSIPPMTRKDIVRMFFVDNPS